MKRKISDLLDGYQDDTILLEAAAPLSAQRIKELTMSKIEKKKNPVRKGTRIISKILIAAAVISAMTITAAAASRDDNWLSLFLRRREQGAMTDSQVRYISENTKNAASERAGVDDSAGAAEKTKPAPLGSATADGYTVTVDAVLADAKDAYILLTLSTPEGAALDADDYYFDTGSQLKRDGRRLSFLDESGKRTYNTPDGNTASMFCAFRLPDFYEDSFTDGKPFTLALNELHGVWGTGESAEDRLISSGTWEMEITFQADGASLELPVEPFAVPLMPDVNVPEDEKGEGTEAYITAIRLSPLSMALQFGVEGDQEYGNQFPESYVVLRGGERIQLTQRVTDIPGGTAGFSANAPIVLEGVDYVLIGSQKIPADS